MAGDDPLTFPDAPRVELEQALERLIGEAQKVLTAQGRLRALIRANDAVVSHLELPDVLRTIVEAAVDLVAARYGALGVVGEDGLLAQFIHVGMSAEEITRVARPPQGRGLVGALIDDPRPIRVDAIADDPRSVGFPAGHPEMTAFLGVPIRVHGTVYGNLYLTNPAGGTFNDDDEQLVTALAASAGFAIANARLYAETVARQQWAAALTGITAGILGESVTPWGAVADALVALDDARTVHVYTVDAAALTLRQDAVGIARSDSAGTTRSDVAGTTRPDSARTTGSDSVGTADGADGPPSAPLDNAHVRRAVDARTPTRVRALGPFAAIAGEAPGPALVVPFTAGDDRLRLVVVTRAAGQAAFTDFDLERTDAFVKQGAFAVELLAARAEHTRAALLEDRARIARDLHDQVIQQLFGAGLEVQSVQGTLADDPRGAQLERIVDELDEAIRQIRTVIFALSHDDAAEALRRRVLDIVRDAAGPLAGAITVSFTGPVDVVGVAAVGDDVAAFVREGLTNVVKHACARSAAVTVEASADAVVATISDDGVGLGEARRRSGLANLARRAERHGGDFDVSSTSAGTTLRLRLPVPATGPEARA